MIDNRNDGGGGIVFDIADWRDCDALKGTIEVPMLKPMRIACDDRRFIAMYIISMIAVTARIVTFVLVFVVVGFTRGIVLMDVRMVSSTMAMIEGAHDISRMRSNRKWSLHGLKENAFRRSVNVVSRLGRCRIGDRRFPVGRPGRAQTRS